jgi:hypothetical protein
MSNIVHDFIAAGEARIVDLPAPEPVRDPHVVDRSFGLPRALYGATVGCYLGFVAILGTAFANPEMVLPAAIFALFIIAGFWVPTLWVRLKDNPTAQPTLGDFSLRGVMTHTGRLAPRDATIQVLILPVLLVIWGLAVALIAAIVA